MTSLSYSYTAKWYASYGPEEYWMESIYRGFDQEGMGIFRQHSCVSEDHPFFCPTENDYKACIINNFEHDLAMKYPCDKVLGLYPSDAPEPLLFKKEVWRTTWIKNLRYWRMLVEYMGFPIAKVNEPEQIGDWEYEGLLKNCTQKLPRNEIFEGLDFSVAMPLHQRRWERLPRKIQQIAEDILGFNKAKWNRRHTADRITNKSSWKELTIAERNAWLTLECSPVKFDRRECHVLRPDE